MEIFIKKLFKKIDFPKEASIDFFDNLFVLYKANKQKIDLFINQYNNTEFDFLSSFDKFSEILNNTNIDRFRLSLLYIVLLTKNLKKLYAKNHLNSYLFYSTIKDITYKVVECKLVENEFGISCIEWYLRFFDLKIFALGRLQFELTNFSADIDGIKSDEQAIAIHIPRTLEKLESDKVDESINMAKKFFKPYFAGKRMIFTCNSWLLSPQNLRFLDENSNIIKFQKRFKIAYSYKLADYDELWRIFDCKFNGLDSLKDTSSLRRGYIEIVKNKELLQNGFGYFVVEK